MGLIDTDVLFAQMKEYYERQTKEANMTGNRVVCVTWDDAIILIKNAPIVDAVPVRHAKLLNAHPYGECSNCGYLIDIREKFNYCPNCGARMDADE